VLTINPYFVEGKIIMLSSLIPEFASQYLTAKNQPFKEHPLGQWFKSEFGNYFNDVISRSDLKITCSIGQGNWAQIPWIGIFNPEMTVKAEEGFYAVILFSANMEEVYFCQGQVVTEPRKEFGKKFKAEMQRRAELIRDRVPEYSKMFLPGPVSLGGSTLLAKDYDPSVAFYIKFQTLELPIEDILTTNIIFLVNCFDLLVARGGIDNLETATDLLDDSGSFESVIEKRRNVRHSRIERNSNASKNAKKAHGYKCQGCGFDYAKYYGERGEGYIEAHHLTPLESLDEGKVVSMDPELDFSVLCANCHRIVHRTKPILTMYELRNLFKLSSLRKLQEK